MRLLRLYSNHPDVFKTLAFNEGLSVVLAEIRVPANRDLDTHNLGKTTVGELIDFCLLKGKSKDFFLFKHEARFADFTFYLSLELLDGSYLTVARAVVTGSRASFIHTADPVEDATALSSDDWDHFGVPFDRARLLLDGLLALDAVKPWGYRKLVGYLIRSQGDYLDVFQLGKFSGKHQDWKPFVAHLLGLNAQQVIALYAKREELSEATAHLKTLIQEWGVDDVDPSVIDGLISVKRRDIEATTRTLESFNFGASDQSVTVEVVDSLEATISALNEERYRTAQLIAGLSESLEEEKIIFRTEDAVSLFTEAGVAFGSGLKRDFDQLVAFNRAITVERREALREQIADARARATDIDSNLKRLNTERARSLEYLRESESLAKYRQLSLELASRQADLNTLEAKRAAASRLIELRREQRSIAEEYGQLQSAVEREIEEVSRNEESPFGLLRQYFTEIIFDVLGQNAIIAIRLNGQGGLDFTAEFVGDSGIATSGDKGTSYRKLLCIAFDLAMLRAHLEVPFARFVYHDGALEQLEPRKRQNLIGVFRRYAEYGIQPVISSLDSDLPEGIDSSKTAITSGETVVVLHDEGDEGRLFMMPSW